MEIKEIVETLSLEEKVRLLSGVGSWHTYDCNGKLPSIMMSDGPHGLRKQEFEDYTDINKSEIATCFPTASAIASSWNVDAAGKLAAAIANEAVAQQVSIVLGCGINIKRSPLCGRNFEYFSEDPYLAGKMAAAYITAMQEQGVGTSLKHFAANNQETRRMTQNSQIDERALREIYLQAFEIAVKEAQPTTVMGSYNRLNGAYACANKHLLTDILRKEWGFKGAVISDWGAAIDVVECIKAGLDLEMPDNLGIHTKQIMEALQQKQLTEEEIDKLVSRLVELITRQHEKKRPGIVDFDRQHEIARELACESAVLLKNDGILPLDKKAKVLVVGEMAVAMRFQGGGSSHITTDSVPSAVRSLEEKGLEVHYVQGYQSKGDQVEGVLEQEALEAAREGVPVLFFGGLTDSFEGEGYDRKRLAIPSCQLQLLEKIYEVNRDIVFVSFGGSAMEMSFLDHVRAVLHMYLGGEAVGEACSDLLTGDVNPSGKLAETFPYKLEDVPSYPFYALDSDDVEYRESLFVGYRYYVTFHKKTLFDFGYGLSYTTFQYSDIQVGTEQYGGGNLTVRFRIQNTGNCKGAEAAQLYVQNPRGNYIRPARELRGFVKVELEPGERREVSIVLDKRSFSVYDKDKGAFVMPAGDYIICVGASVSDIRLTAGVQVKSQEARNDKEAGYDVYMNLEKEGTASLTKEDFRLLYGQPFSCFDEVKKGEYTIYHSLNALARHSVINRIVKKLLVQVYYGMNKQTPRDDLGLQMIIGALCEGPLDCVVCGSGGIFPLWAAKLLVGIANGFHHKK